VKAASLGRGCEGRAPRRAAAADLAASLTPRA